jgi:hypothetical protein
MEINTQNYESYFLLYIDNELTASQKKEVASFIAANPEYEQTLIQLQKTILVPEEIEFEDKMLLYRFEEMEATLTSSFKKSLYRNESKVIKGFFGGPAKRYAMAVAALFICIIGYQWISETQAIETGKSLVQTANANNAITLDNNAAKLPATINQTNQVIQEHTLPSKSIAYTNTQTTNQQNTAQILPETRYEVAENQHRSTVQTSSQMEAANPIETIIVPAATNVRTSASETVSASVNNNSNNSESYENVNTDNADRTIYVANFEIDGEKLRGLGRRFNALLKRNKTDKEK